MPIMGTITGPCERRKEHIAPIPSIYLIFLRKTAAPLNFVAKVVEHGIIIILFCMVEWIIITVIKILLLIIIIIIIIIYIYKEIMVVVVVAVVVVVVVVSSSRTHVPWACEV